MHVIKVRSPVTVFVLPVDLAQRAHLDQLLLRPVHRVQGGSELLCELLARPEAGPSLVVPILAKHEVELDRCC